MSTCLGVLLSLSTSLAGELPSASNSSLGARPNVTGTPQHLNTSSLGRQADDQSLGQTREPPAKYLKYAGKLVAARSSEGGTEFWTGCAQALRRSNDGFGRGAVAVEGGGFRRGGRVVAYRLRALGLLGRVVAARKVGGRAGSVARACRCDARVASLRAGRRSRRGGRGWLADPGVASRGFHGLKRRHRGHRAGRRARLRGRGGRDERGDRGSRGPRRRRFRCPGRAA